MCVRATDRFTIKRGLKEGRGRGSQRQGLKSLSLNTVGFLTYLLFQPFSGACRGPGFPEHPDATWNCRFVPE